MSLFLPHRRSLALGRGVPLTLVIGGYTYYLLRDDLTLQTLKDTATGKPIYARRYDA